MHIEAQVVETLIVMFKSYCKFSVENKMKFKINEGGCIKMLFMPIYAAFLLLLDPK